MVDLTGAQVFVVPGPCKVITFPWPGWFAVMHVLTPEEHAALWIQSAVVVNPLQLGRVAFVCAERVG